MDKEPIEAKIKELESQLTGVLFEDQAILAIIRRLKAKLGIEESYEEDGCLYCGS